MSITCSKQFTLDIAATSEVYAYFKLDEASPADLLVDEVAGENLTIDLSGGTSVAGKIGTAVLLGDGVSSPQWQSATSSHWLFPGSFTIRFWLKPYLSSGTKIILNSHDGWQFTWQSGDTLDLFIDTVDGNAWVQTNTLTMGAWNRVVAWFEQGVGCGIKVNNAAAVTAVDTSALDFPATSELLLSGYGLDLGAGFAIDEIAMWNRKLTDAEMLYDWNGGAGRTYPDVP